MGDGGSKLDGSGSLDRGLEICVSILHQPVIVVAIAMVFTTVIAMLYLMLNGVKGGRTRRMVLDEERTLQGE